MDVDASSQLADERVTAVVIDKGEGIAKNAKGKVVWLWSGDEAKHSTVTVRHVSLLVNSDPT